MNSINLNNLFTNKDEYLVWRAHWRKTYKELSELIREYKSARKDESAHVRAHASSCCHIRRNEAFALMALRTRSKELAQQQYLAAKAAKEPALS